VIAAERVPVHDNDTVERLRARVQAVEHRLLPKTVRALIESGVRPFESHVVKGSDPK
jgi:folate-dependent phosphoribosylglycinamide formyltransferase PurN